MGKVSVKQLAAYAVDQLESGKASSDVATAIASLLLQERRSRELPQVLKAVEAELSARGSTQVTVTSANAVSADVKAKLATLLEVDEPVFTEVIDKSVIGGVKAKAGESEIDLTVRGRLNRFKKQVISSN